MSDADSRDDDTSESGAPIDDPSGNANPNMPPSDNSSPQDPPANGSRPAAMAFILVTLFIDILGIGIVIPVLPELVKSFVKGDNTAASYYVGIIGATYALMQFLFAPVMGALSDRFGRRPIILASLFGLGIDFLVQGFAPSITWLFAGRVFAGIMGASVTTAYAYIADVSTPANRARNFGLVGVMFGLAFICGPALGGLLGAVHLRLPFFVSAGLALINWGYGYFVLPESLPKSKRSSFSLRNANPLGSLRLLAVHPIVSGLATALLCLSLAQRGLENVWVLHADYRYGWTALENGLILCLVGFMAALVQGFLVGKVIKRIGERHAVTLGIGVSGLTFTAYGAAAYGWQVPFIIIMGAIGGVAMPAARSIMAGAVDASNQGKIQGALTSLTGLTSIVAPLLFTTVLFGYFTSENAPYKVPGIPFYVGGLLHVLALTITIRLFSRVKDPVAVDEAAVATSD